MLVISRRKNEQIRINDNVILTVFRIQGGKVRLGIECPQKIPIRRSEVPLETLCPEESTQISSTDSHARRDTELVL